MKDKMTFKHRLKVTIFRGMKKLGIFPLHLNMYQPGDVEKIIEDQHFQIIETKKIIDGIPAIFIVARK
jgi:hypothetical protein